MMISDDSNSSDDDYRTFASHLIKEQSERDFMAKKIYILKPI